MLEVTPRLQIPDEELLFTFARSSGPGGQNVNKVSSKAVLHWNIAESPSVPADVRQRFLARYRNRVTREGVLVLSSQRYRDQGGNIEDCRAKLSEMLLAVAVAPVKRRATKRTRGSNERRLTQKRRSSEKKQGRRDSFDA